MEEDNDNRQSDNALILHKKWIIPSAVTGIIVVLALLFFFRPHALGTITFNAVRIKNTISYYVFHSRIHFYYLEMEKNGKNIRVHVNESLEITYRDEFVVKSAITDDMKGTNITVNVEGLGKGENDIGVLMRGIDLVNKVMAEGIMSRGGGTVSDYSIRINYGKDVLARVPIKVVITPQDWLRFAKGTTDIKTQIEYLKKAIVVNKEDTGVRKILAGIYARRGKLDDAVKLYQQILTINPEDKVALRELAKCHIRKNEFDRAVEIF
ncbi:MAG: tetratricopeptide repeat protein, partial [Syntrophaceae bacterium]|nr:tetratricopeptide repeat protein [Syntrophaceae bacterium]